MNKVYWIIGVMCSGKTYYSNIIGSMLGLVPFHLDHIDQTKPLTEAYREAIQTGLVEGYTPFRNAQHYNTLMEVLKDYEIIYILIEPEYHKWKENSKPIIACPTDENPPDYTEEEYKQENNRLRELTNPIITIH